MFNKNTLLNILIAPLPHSSQLPIPVPPKTWELYENALSVEDCTASLGDEGKRYPDFLESTNTEPHLINQSELDNLVVIYIYPRVKLNFSHYD